MNGKERLYDCMESFFIYRYVDLILRDSICK
ncbi:hypothetical protein CLNEO_12620 [Anaerotignum neopropionicum]|uniref:Uncharacterized protein n=1 Tax=Anaerotignum neopropionicum TaxID=36847 RepID=A0A136WFJ6_9FIRM|nr:hypothetical protein CLNEO_12620 [Anaerotignum neopropionicum]